MTIKRKLGTVRQRRLAWIEMLESGRYKQTSGKLLRRRIGTKPSYCCLGVACQLYKQWTGEGRWEWWNGGCFTLDGTHYTLLPPTKVMHELFDIKANDVNGLTDKKSAAEMNDYEYSFKEIASALRKKFGFPPRKK